MSYHDLLIGSSPEIVLVLTALAVLALGLTRGAAGRVALAMAAIGVLVAVAAVAWSLHQRVNLEHGMLVLGPLNALLEVVCLLLAFFSLLLTPAEISLRNRGEYLVLFLFATMGLLLLVSSEELLMIFVGLELTGLSLYLLTGFERGMQRSGEAGLKYFLFGSMASAFTLYGLSLLYGFTGTTGLAGLSHRLSGMTLTPLLAIGMAMTLFGFAFKIAAAPFHFWAPDAYEGAPASAAAFIASGSKVASFFVLGKIVLTGFAGLAGNAGWQALVLGWSPLLALLSAFSILLGSLVALVQNNLRRLLAYSAVAHGGYTLLGLITGGREGLAAMLFYIVVYAATLAGAFGIVAIVRAQTGSDDLSAFVGLRARSPLLAACLTVFILSLAGLPPLPGFFGKFYLFSVTLHAGANQGLLWLVIVALVGSLISLYYYLVVLKVVLVHEASGISSPPRPSAYLPRISVSLLAAIVLFLGLWPSALVGRILAAIQ